MKNDLIKFYINIYCPDSLLMWLLIISFLGALITGVGLVKIESFLINSHENKSVKKLQSIHSLSRMKVHLNGLLMNDLLLVRKHLILDFAFMPFFYLLLHTTTVLILRLVNMGAGWHTVLHILTIIPLAALLFDVIENSITLSIVSAHQKKQEITRSQTTSMFLFSLLKWVFLSIWLLGIVCYTITFLVSHIQ